MKVRCQRNLLDEALGFVSHAVSGRSSFPVLSHLYMEAQDDSVRLVGSDLEQWVEYSVPAIVGEAGKATVPAKLLAELIGSLESEEVDLELGERSTMWVKAGGSEYRLVGLPPEDYPPIPELEDPSRFTLPASQFMDLVESVEFAVSKEEVRAALTGIKMEYEGSTLRLVATDTHRLAVRSVNIQLGSSENAGDVAAIVPLKAIRLVQRLPVEDQYELHLSAHRAVFGGANARVATQLIEGQYPNYQRVIPTQSTRRWVLMTSEFKKALKRAYLVARENANKVALRTSGEKLIITARGEGVGEALESIDVVREGDDLEIAFNARYLLDLLDVVKDEGITVELTEPLRPALFKSAEQADYECVVMPMAL